MGKGGSVKGKKTVKSCLVNIRLGYDLVRVLLGGGPHIKAMGEEELKKGVLSSKNLKA